MRVCVGGLAVLFALVAIGCGGGGGTTEVALTKAQFIKRGDAVCREAQKPRTRAINAWFEENPTARKGEEPSTKELGELYLAVQLPVVKEASDELAALDPPAGDIEAEKFVDLFSAAVRTIEEEPTRVFKKGYRSADKVALAYGFEDCGRF